MAGSYLKEDKSMSQLGSDNYQRENYHVGIYCRLSHEDGETGESNSIGNQKAMLTKYVMDKGWSIADIYIDDGYTGVSFERPGFMRLLQDIKAKKISMVITKDMSRLGRDYIQVGHYIEKFFPENRVRFIAVNDNIDTGNLEGNDMTPFKAVINDMYCKDISKKVRSVFNHKRHEGKFIGAFAPYGYEKDPKDNSHLIIDKEIAPTVRRMFQLYISGYGFTAIAKKLNEEGIPSPAYYKNRKYETFNVGKARVPKWSHSSVKAILKNPVYTGVMAQNKSRKINYKSRKTENLQEKDWIVVEGTHEAIISPEDFKKVKTLMKHKNNDFSGAKKAVKLFSGFAFCGDCGEYMTYTKAPSGNYFLICSGYKRFGKSHCTRHSILEEKLEEMILKDFRKLVRKFADRERLKKKAEQVVNKRKTSKNMYEDELTSVDKRLGDIQVMLKSLYEDKVKGVIDEEQFLEFYNAFNKEKVGLNNRYDELKKFLNITEKQEDKQKKVEQLVDDTLNLKKLNRLILAEMIEKVEVLEFEDIKINYKIKNPCQ
ncbi:recombinase family protein [Natronincola ferrireducens]|uniref:Site-specific DNA recombinase n=1 Tax=Natronincola ferrireducens TaxID=393762 RepID=A0A1G9H071_9FIRM|nr:recombinase family protein [Natronincola ferrireducens]SDL06360.1 Site-specific DNA recombinase [Natronincola ferrireducens]